MVLRTAASILFSVNPALSVRIIGVLGCLSLNVLTAANILLFTSSDLNPPRFGKQSNTKTLASISAIKSINSFSNCPLPEKPRLTIGIPSFLSRIAVHAIPGREAHPPWAIDVP
ncbi:hypothetical protein D3C87_1500480 [compost metagenome]